MHQARPIRVLLVDDHTLLRAGLRSLLDMEPDIEVVGEAASGEAAVELLPQVGAEVVLMDLTMPGMGGLEATREICRAYPAARVLVLTMQSEQEYVIPVLEAGGCGFVTKHSADHELLDAIRTAAAGDVYLGPAAARILTQSYRAPRPASEQRNPLLLLSERELEVLRLTASGFTAPEIGERLAISSKTVDTYRQRFMGKLKLKHRSDLIRFAVERDLLEYAG
jgi:two-component system, NarL family, response regulator NreC